jgi:hypothetical protein
MKQRSKGILFLWVLIAAIAAGGTFLICEHLGAGAVSDTGTGPMVAEQPGGDAQPDMNADTDAGVGQNNSTVADGGGAVPMQTFSNDGYALSIPANWNIETTASDTIAVHPDAASPDAACKIEVSAFPFASGTDVAGWIGDRIGGDPSLSVVEQSSEDVSVNGGSGVKWTGTIDGIPTTLVYLFSDGHAYEIAPSVIGENADGNAQCGDMLGTLLSTIKI